MTVEDETDKVIEEFYKVMEIKPATVEQFGASYFWDTIEVNGERYTPIDNSILLQLLCLLSTKVYSEVRFSASNVTELKGYVLQEYIDFVSFKRYHYKTRNKVKKLVQKIFAFELYEKGE